MMTDAEMTDAEVADQIERADRFIADFREMIAATVVDPASACADYQRRGLRRIADTLDAVPYVTFCNLANLNAAMRGGLLDLIEVQAPEGTTASAPIFTTEWARQWPAEEIWVARLGPP